MWFLVFWPLCCCPGIIGVSAVWWGGGLEAVFFSDPSKSKAQLFTACLCCPEIYPEVGRLLYPDSSKQPLFGLQRNAIFFPGQWFSVHGEWAAACYSHPVAVQKAIPLLLVKWICITGHWNSFRLVDFFGNRGFLMHLVGMFWPGPKTYPPPACQAILTSFHCWIQLLFYSCCFGFPCWSLCVLYSTDTSQLNKPLPLCLFSLYSFVLPLVKNTCFYTESPSHP